MQADRRSTLVSPESIDTPPQTIIPVDEHGSSNIRAFAGMRAVSMGLVCGEKHASGDNVTTTTKYRTLYRLMGGSLSIRSDLSGSFCPYAAQRRFLLYDRISFKAPIANMDDLTHQNKRLDCSYSKRARDNGPTKRVGTDPCA
jgi:hypothetical protein